MELSKSGLAVVQGAIPMAGRRQVVDACLSPEQLAERWGVSRDTVYRITRRQLHYFKVGRQRRYRQSDIEAYERSA